MTSVLRTSSYILPAAALLLTASVASAALMTPSTPDFIKNAAIGGMYEIQSSQLADQKSTNPAIKQFAEKMISDHTTADNQLMAAVQSDPSLPAPPTQLDSKHQKMLDKLGKESGADFDKDYVKQQASAHKDTVSLFQKYADKGDNAALKNLAGTTLPELQQHLQSIKQLKASM